MRGHELKPFSCQECGELLVFYACDELSAEERAAVEEHVGRCAACAASLAAELRLQQVVAGAAQPADRLDPAGSLLAQCRSELAEALDEIAPRRGPGGRLLAIHPRNWMFPSLVRHPAWSSAMLIVLGVGVGAVASQWLASPGSPTSGPVVRVSAAPKISEQDLQNMSVGEIKWVPAGSGPGAPSFELHLRSAKPVEIRGNLDDMDVKRVLTYVVTNGQRFDAGVRLDSVDVLRTRSGDHDVRLVLCAAVRKDPNPGVRLKALEALRGFEQDQDVRQALLDALMNDQCPGVRIEAINSLQNALLGLTDERGFGPDEQRLVNVLRDRMRKDPNNYIRMRSAAAIRQLGPREVY